MEHNSSTKLNEMVNCAALVSYTAETRTGKANFDSLTETHPSGNKKYIL